ncbi:MAG: sigma-70 family RNA polymerase sigma factor [bacterium]
MDRSEFEELVAPHRKELHAHCYRMLGSVHDADDALQDALLGAWRGRDTFAGKSSLRAWLFRIATNACLHLIAQRPRRLLSADYQRAASGTDIEAMVLEPIWLEPYPEDPEARVEQREQIELAFVAALQHLPGTQRAVLLVRDVLGFSAEETAGLLEVTVATVNSALQRARATLDASGVKTAGPPAKLDDATRELLARYVDAFERYDLDSLTSLIHEDATQSMPPFALWLRGRAEILRFWFGPGAACRGSRLIATAANGSPAFGQYKPSGPGGRHEPWSLQVLEIENGRIVEMSFFLSTESLFPLFRLPHEP